MKKRLKIIVVDDNETFREGICFFIEKILFHEVMSVHADGKEFIDANQYKNADIVLMDIEMPNMNGVEATKKAIWNHNSLAAIAITGYQDKAYLSEFIGAGFKGCVFKENIYDDLNNAIENVINGRFHYPQNINLSR